MLGEKGLSINISKRIGELLVSSGRITSAQLNEALDMQRAGGGKLGQVLVHKKFIKESELLEFLSKQFGIEFVDLAKKELQDDVVKIIPENIARRYSLIAVAKSDHKLKVAMEDPLNIVVLDDLKMMTGYDVQAVFGSETDILAALDKYYGAKSSKQALDDILRLTTDGTTEVAIVKDEDSQAAGDDLISLE